MLSLLLNSSLFLLFKLQVLQYGTFVSDDIAVYLSNTYNYYALCIGPFTPYQIRMTATICQSPVEIYNQIVYTRQGINY